MELAVKALVVPHLRSLGFKGSMPHFRRQSEGKADLLTFQFNLYGGSFVVELSVCSEADIAAHWRADLTLKNVTAHDMNFRQRLGSTHQSSDHWFVYGKKNHEPGHEAIESTAHYERIASEVANLVESQAINWWATHAGCLKQQSKA